MPISVSSFVPDAGTREYFLVATPIDTASFENQLSTVFDLYDARVSELNIDRESAVYLNLYVSDAIRCDHLMHEYGYFTKLSENNIAVSILEMPPLFSSVILFAYHAVSETAMVKDRIPLKNAKAEAVSLTSNSRHHYFLKGLTSSNSNSIKEQTRSVLGQIASFCRDRSISYRNIIRTWLYIRDMDRNYKDMSNVRTELFHDWGLNEIDGFPASTGIGAGTTNPGTLVSLDAIILDGIENEQVQKMEASSHMSTTMAYGVTFERGLKINYGDRSHMYISGTASIDSRGNVLYPGDLMGQTRRSLENIRVLLDASDSSIDDIVYLIVYFRDLGGAEQVDSYLKTTLHPHIPYILLKGTVCRPEWLIEIEGMAISKEHHPQYKGY
jgi:enamine deaminase RidA (YjgF/YER057c/UK114 family)